jgi:predicted nucleotidyltransferase
MPDQTDQPTTRASYLSPPDFHRLDWACRPIAAAFGGTPVYLVGSVLRTAAYRDIDLRLILPDEEAAAFAGPVRLLLNIALSDLIAKAAGLAHPIDFQIQSMTEANTEDGARDPLGLVGIPGRL